MPTNPGRRAFMGSEWNSNQTFYVGKGRKSILTCQEIPSARLGEREKTRRRLEVIAEWNKRGGRSKSEWQRLFTAERQRCSRMWTTCQETHETCSLCGGAQNDGVVRLSSRPIVALTQNDSTAHPPPDTTRSSAFQKCMQMHGTFATANRT